MDIKKREFIRQECLYMAKKGIIEESTSRWNAPIVLTKKRTGGFRLCIDFRELNDRTIKKVCQPPTIEECVNTLSGATVFSQIDLERGYHQVPMEKSSRELTAFMTPIGKFQYRMMPFGLTNAPATFQRLMYKVFRDLINSNVVAYMDDITIYSKAHEEHHKDVIEVHTLLSDNGLKINSEKSEFCKKKISLLGFSVEDGKVFPDEERLGPFKETLKIETIKQLHSFVGCAGYFRNFIKNFAEKTFKLNEIISRKRKFETNEVADLVNSLWKELIGTRWFSLPDMDKNFIIEADASDYCIGAVLKQAHDNKEVAIIFCSMNLIQAERNYTTLEKETLAIIYAIKIFKNYLHRKFIIRTDHKSLVWLYKIKNPRGRIARWLMFLCDMEFQLNIKKVKIMLLQTAYQGLS
jgi:hypothetical protein